MKKIVCVSLLLAYGLFGCQPALQLAIPTIEPTIHASEISTNTPDVQISATSTLKPTTTPTKTPFAYSTSFPLPSEVISPENIKDLHELAVYGKGMVKNFSYSPDGSLLAVATTRGIYFYDTFTYLEKNHIATSEPVNSVAFSPSGETLAITTARGSVKLWDLASSELLEILEQNTGRAGGMLLFSPDGSYLFSGSGDAVIRMWQIPDGELIRTFRGRSENYNNNMAISPDGSLLASTDGYEKVWVWRAATGELIRTLDGNLVSFSPDGKILAVGKGMYSTDLTVTLWQVSDWILINSLTGHRGKFLSIAFSPDGESLLVNDSWRDAKIWDISEPSVSTCFQCGQKNFEFLFFSPGGSTVTSLDWDGILQVWSVPDEELLYTFHEHMGEVTSLAFSPNGNFLASNSPSFLGVWQISDSTLVNITTYKSYNDLSSLPMAFTLDNNFLVFGPFLNGVKLWEFGSSNQYLALRDGDEPSSIKISPNGTVVALGVDQTVEFRSIWDGTLLETLTLENSGFSDTLAFSHDAKLLAVGRYGKVEVWRLSDKTLVQTLEGIGYWLNDVVFSSNGNIFATGTLNTAQWDGETGKQLQSLSIRGHTFSPALDFVVAVERNEIQFYRLSDGKFIGKLKFRFFVRDVAFSLDGTLLGVAGDDGTIGIWGILPK